MNTASNKLSSSLERQAGAGKPVDPATRLSELLAQSLEELTRPFDPPKPGPVPLRPEQLRPEPAEEAGSGLTPEETRIDADKALAELEAELFAAAQQVSRDLPEAPQAANEDVAHHDTEEEHPVEHLEEQSEADVEEHADEPHDAHADDHDDLELPQAENLDEAPDAVEPAAVQAEEPPARIEAAPTIIPSPFLSPEPEATYEARPDADASAVIAKVRKLMLVSMAVTLVAVGSVFAFIGYRIFKGEGAAAKTADKLPEAAIPADITLALPRGARVIQSAVSGDRLVMTLEIDGKIEVRTFDVNTLQPAGRLNFSSTP
jgi:hypothetical protein